MNLDSMKDILAAAQREEKPLWQIIVETDMENRGVTREDSFAKMAQAWHAMLDASNSYSGKRRSASGLVGGQGEQIVAHPLLVEHGPPQVGAQHHHEGHGG